MLLLLLCLIHMWLLLCRLLLLLLLLVLVLHLPVHQLHNDLLHFGGLTREQSNRLLSQAPSADMSVFKDIGGRCAVLQVPMMLIVG